MAKHATSPPHPLPTGKRKILVAMSGGVDSSVAAALLKRAGHEVVGCFMRLGSPGETLDELIPDGPGSPDTCRVPTPTGSHPLQQLKIGHQGCCSISDAADARQVAAELDIPFYVCNFKKDFGRIIDYFVDEYADGRTPNPCVRCNDWLKFGKLHDYAQQIGADAVASGHYARIALHEGRNALYKGLDASKDQSYVLFGAPRHRLDHMLFPIGELPKSRVRELAREMGLPVFDKPDSQEICFVPDNDYAGLVQRRRPAVAKPGDILNEQGHILGRHEGQHHFTIGQRRGLDVALGERAYVIAKDATTNTITIGPKARLAIAACTVTESNWLCDPASLDANQPIVAKFRYNTPPGQATFTLLPDAPPGPSGRPGSFHVTFTKPQIAIAPGQALVLYQGDRVLGGGWIARSHQTLVETTTNSSDNQVTAIFRT